jgi:hypothetical protein
MVERASQFLWARQLHSAVFSVRHIPAASSIDAKGRPWRGSRCLRTLLSFLCSDSDLSGPPLAHLGAMRGTALAAHVGGGPQRRLRGSIIISEELNIPELRWRSRRRGASSGSLYPCPLAVPAPCPHIWRTPEPLEPTPVDPLFAQIAADQRLKDVSPAQAIRRHGRTNQRVTPNERAGRAPRPAVHRSRLQE